MNFDRHESFIGPDYLVRTRELVPQKVLPGGQVVDTNRQDFAGPDSTSEEAGMIDRKMEKWIGKLLRDGERHDRHGPLNGHGGDNRAPSFRRGRRLSGPCEKEYSQNNRPDKKVEDPWSHHFLHQIIVIVLKKSIFSENTDPILNTLSMSDNESHQRVPCVSRIYCDPVPEEEMIPESHSPISSISARQTE